MAQPTAQVPQGLEQFDEQSRVNLLSLSSLFSCLLPLPVYSRIPLQRELGQFLEQEQVKAQLQTQIHQFTERCFDK